MSEHSGAQAEIRPLIDVIGLPSPETCRRLVVLLRLAEPRMGRGADAAA
ncbi:hypothetical protein [Streptosporangium sp. NPDC004631]